MFATQSKTRRFSLAKKVVGATLAGLTLAGPFAHAGHAEPFGRFPAVDNNTLKVVNDQEDGIFSDGDEPYVQVICYRTTLGVPNTTRAWAVHGMRELSSGAHTGRTLAIPDSQGRCNTSGTPVIRRSMSDLLAGRHPEMVGAITVVAESDATPDALIDQMMNRGAAEAQRRLGPIFASLGVGASVDPGQLARQLILASRQIFDAVKGSSFDQFITGISSLGDPDDVLGWQATGFIAVDGTAAPTVEAWLSMFRSLIPTNVVLGAMTPRTWTTRFSRSGATYDVTSSLTI